MAPNESKLQNLPIAERKIKGNRKWAYCEPGEEVVISGIAGVFPDSDNVLHLEENLLAKKDLVTDDDRRWKQENSKIPKGLGKLSEIDKFDAEFFGISEKTAQVMDPMGRILLEKTYEAIVDAGYNPKELRGSKTGVFIGASFGAAEPAVLSNRELWNSDTIAGMVLCMLANRISYWLDVHGPSFTLDTACSSSLYALENAYKAMRIGDCDAAIVGGCNLCLQPNTSYLFTLGGYLSPEGRCKCFDESANGYCRSESVAVILLQKKKDARRIYAQVVHAKSNCDGYKEEGIHFPSTEIQMSLLRELYEECGVNPSTLKLVEAHATGTKVGDPQELRAMEAIFLPGRTEPLTVGSIKSNIGHPEPASGLCSVIKLILSYESGIIFPNIHLTNLRSEVDSFKNGKMKVVTEPTPWNGGLSAVNNFGFGGANCHVLLDSNKKIKTKNGVYHSEVPRLVAVSGRTEEAVDTILNDLEEKPVDAEYIGLLHKIYEQDISAHYFRGYALIKENKERVRSVTNFSGEKRPIWYVFTGMGSQWPTMGKSLMKIPLFAESIKKCQKVLITKHIDLIKIISSKNTSIFDNILNSYVGIVAIQIALTDVLSEINVEADGFLGHSVGEIGCAYADGCLTAEQAILVAYYRGLTLLNAELNEGSMAAIGLGFEEVSKILPSDIDIGCHNGSNSCTISGPVMSVKNFVESLQREGVFAREVNSSNFALHSRYIEDVGPTFLEYLKNINLQPKLRSKKWISSSFLEYEWSVNVCKYFSKEYLVTNMLGTVYFEEALRYIPKNAIVIEIAPHGLLQAILKRSLDEGNVNIPLTSRSHSDNSEYFLCAVGKIFEAGVSARISKLYPPIAFPVSRGTPMISPLVKWDHNREWYVYKHGSNANSKLGQRTVSISLKEDEHKYLFGHVVNGKAIYPASGYLVLVWETLAFMTGKPSTDVSVLFRNVNFHRMTNLHVDGIIEFVVTLRKDRNDFEIIENGDLVVNGKIYELENDNESNKPQQYQDIIIDPELLQMNTNDVYKELRSRGYQYKGLFRGVAATSLDGSIGRISWTDNFVSFIDTMLHMRAIMENFTRPPRVPVSFQKVVINPKKHFNILGGIRNEEPELNARGCKQTDYIQCGGVEIEIVQLATVKQRVQHGKLVVEKIDFIPHINPRLQNLEKVFKIISLITSANSMSKALNIVELVNKYSNTNDALMSQFLLNSFKELPLVQVNLGIIAPADHPLITDELKELTKEIKKLPCDESFFMIIASHILNQEVILQNCLKSLKPRGFLLLKENTEGKVSFDELNLNVCFEVSVQYERILLLRKATEVTFEPLVIELTRDSYSWLKDVQRSVKESQDLILFSEKDELNGIPGFFNCIREEIKKENMRCFFIMDKTAPPFSSSHPFYKSQIAKNLSMNIYKNRSWGGFYGLSLDDVDNVTTQHAYVNTIVPGDLTTLKWIQGPLNINMITPSENKTLIHVYYAALNFRDVMLATGKITVENSIQKHKKGEFALGMEFAGKSEDGRRYMGISTENAMTNLLECADYEILFPVPDHWTLEGAATVPLVYGTVLYALFMRAHMKKGESILIHSGAGGVGQAAINVCSHYGCEIFTTVGTEAKREFIKKTFPSIPESHIGSSRDESFEKMIKTQTNGKGVDIVLNSLSEEKLQASVRCLAEKGRFLEIGKYDLSVNNLLGMRCFLNEISFHGIDLAKMPLHREHVFEFQTLMQNAMNNGIIKPIIRTVFGTDQLETAFRYMVSGEHIGKVIIKVRDEEADSYAKPTPIYMNAVPRYSCTAEKCYIICGGLGGFGLELTAWLIRRGARNLILTSRNGVSNGYQARRIKLWRSNGAKIFVHACDLSNETQVRKLLKISKNLGPVSAIFNLAAVIHDNLFEDQTEKAFADTAAPKVTGTLNLDKLSRKYCPHLEHFVAFSSASCGLGNPGQTNYGMANSSLERICELRKADNLPALAIQWGAIADVGLLSDMDLDVVLAGTIQQDISSCLELLDHILNQPHPVVRSLLVADKNSSREKSLLDIVAHILGIKDIKKVNPNTKLGDAGVDSITGLEIRNVLEKNYDILLQPKEIRDLTFSKLHEIETNGNNCGSKELEKINEAGNDSTINLAFEYVSAIMNADLSFLDNGSSIMRLRSKLHDTNIELASNLQYPTVFVLPGMDGIPNFMDFLSANLEAHVLCLLYSHTNPHETIEGYTKEMVTHIANVVPTNEPFYIIGFSFGGFVAMETARNLEKSGRSGRLWLIDVFPEFFIEYSFPKICGENIGENLNSSDSIIPEVGTIDQKRQPLLMTLNLRMEAIQTYVKKSYEKLSTVASLIRTQKSLIPSEEDYGLSKYFKHQINVHLIKGNHYSILNKKETAEIIMKEMTLHWKSL